VKGGSQSDGAPFECHAAGSTENLEFFSDASTMTDARDDGKKISSRQKCLSCLENMNRIMVWNSTQTPASLDIGHKVMVWNSTQTPITKVVSVGVQVQIGKLGRLCKWPMRKKQKLHAANARSNVRSEAATGNKCGSYSDASKTGGSFSSMIPTTTLKESRQQSPRQSGLSASRNGNHKSKDNFYRPSPYQACVNNQGQSLFLHYSDVMCDKTSAVLLPVSERSVPPKGILKTRSNKELQQPAASSQMPWQHSSSLPNCDLAEYPVSSPLQAPETYDSSGREFIRSSSNSHGGMGTSHAMQSASSNTGSMFGCAAPNFPAFGNPDIGDTTAMDQNFYGLHHSQFASSLGQSGNPGPGLGMQTFQHQSSMVFPQAGSPSMMPHGADTHY
jgi:hypothetical protein